MCPKSQLLNPNIRPRSRSSERGQGTLEFVLLIIVFIALLLGLTAQFFKPFKRYADYYLGDYVSCLLDEGELPILGNEDSTVDCGTPPSFAADSAAGAKSLAAAEKNASGGSANSESSANSKKGKASGRGSGGGSGDLVSNDGKNFRSKSGSGADGAVASENSTKTDATAGKNPKYIRALGSGGETIVIHRPSRDLDYQMLSPAAKQQVEQEKSSGSFTIEAGASNAPQSPKHLELKTSVGKTGSIDIEDEPWSLGKIFRLVLIILVLIALALVIGGQLNSISKGSEK